MATDDRLYFRQLLSGRDFAAGDMIAQQMRNFAYLIGDRETGDCVVVDPAYAANDLLDALENDGMHLSGVLVSHHHPDHVGGSMMGFELKGLAELLERVSVPVHVNTHEADWVSRVTGIPLSDLTGHDHGDKVTSAPSTSNCCTPRATRRAASASCSTGRLVAGDTLFLDGCGRTDFPGGNVDDMYRSLQALARTTGRSDGVPRPLVLRRAQRGAVGGAAHQLRVPRRQPGSVAHGDGRLMTITTWLRVNVISAVPFVLRYCPVSQRQYGA